MAQLRVSLGEHGDPYHPDGGGQQHREAQHAGLDPPLLVDGACVAVAVCGAGAAQEVQAEDYADGQEAKHIDLQHDKFLLAVLAGLPFSHQHKNQPLCGDDNLHGEEPQGHGRFSPAPGSCKAQKGKTASQQAGEGQREEHAEEEDPGRAGLSGVTDDEGKGDGEDPCCGQQEHGHGGHCASNTAALVLM